MEKDGERDDNLGRGNNIIKFRDIIQCSMLRKLVVVKCGMECLVYAKRKKVRA